MQHNGLIQIELNFLIYKSYFKIGTHFLLTLKTVVFLFHLLSTTSKPFSSLSTRLAHAARLGFFYKNALYKFTVIIYTLSHTRVTAF